MSARLTRGEYWLLAKVATYQLPLALLALPEGPPWNRATIDESMNCMGHGMAADVLAKTLFRLARRGWIEIRPSFDSEPQTFEFEAVLAELSSRQLYPDQACYGLTQRGGEIWEAFARPRWHLYYLDEYDSVEGEADPDISRCDVTTPSRRTLDLYMAARRGEVDIVAGTEEISEVAAWPMTYWKPPCAAWRCSFVFGQRKDLHSFSRTSGTMRKLWCEWQ